MLGNWLKTTILMAGIVALFGVVGAAFGGANGMLLGLALGGAMNIFAYWFSDKMVLCMYRAQEVDAASAPQFYGPVQELSRRAGLPMPHVYLIDEAQPNAFATGRSAGERSNPVVGLIVMILAPIAAMLIQMAIARAREFEADRGGAVPV